MPPPFHLHSAAQKGGGLLVLAAIAYVAGYAWLRATAVQTWPRDGHKYLIFPKSPPVLYYLYRPLSLIDSRLTGLRVHIGPHREETVH